MGGAIAITVAACLRNIEKLVVIDGFGPIVRPEDSAALHLRACILHRLRIKERGSRVFDSMEHAVKARIEKVATYPGMYVCMHAHMYVLFDSMSMLVRLGLRMLLHILVCMYACMHICMYCLIA